MANIEEDFPRGRIPISKARNSFSNKITPFPNENSKKSARKRKRSISPTDGNTSNQITELISTTAEGLTYKKLQEEMLLLGCIRDISPLSIEVELPGKMVGKVPINAISQKFLTLLTEELDKGHSEEGKDVARLNTMFHVGQFVPVKIIQIKEQSHNRTKVILSMNPKHINLDWSHRMFKKGFLLWAAVHSKLDHGYLLDAGILNTRIFLSFQNIEKDATLVIGQPLWCAVQECDVTSSVATIQTTILKKHLEAAVQDTMSLHYVIPGMQFNFTVSKLVKYGIQGEFMNQCLGYINESYLATPLEKVSRYRKQQTIKAWLLYIEPTTKFAYFTLRSVYSVPQPEYENGKTLRGQIISKAGSGLYIKFPNKEKGFVPNKRLLNVAPKNNLRDIINKKFPTDSYHQCRILNYNCMERAYICSFEASILQEKSFTASDMKIGDLVTAKVTMYTPEGLQVSFGKLRGFIQNIHLSNSIYSENIKKQFPVGKTLQAKILSNDKKGIFLTHKQELLNSELCLSSYKDAVVGQQYPGVVVNKSKRGVLVVFYAEIRGMLFRKHLLEIYPEYQENMYYEGQVIMTTIRRVMDDFLHLSLVPSEQPKSKQIKIGEYVDAVVTTINKSGLEVAVEPYQIKAVIPTAHLSSSLTLTPSLLETYKVGDTLNGLLCISANEKLILSMREANAYKNQNLEIMKKLRPGSLLRCSYEKSDKSGIYVTAPLHSKSVTFMIPYKEILDEGYNKKMLNFQPQQAIVVKVLELDEHHNISAVTAKQSQVFNGNYQYSLDLLEQYLHDTEQIRTHLSNNGSPLAELELGQRVECKICKVTDKGCKVLLQNDVVGFVSPTHYSKNMNTGQVLTGTILWVNYTQHFVEISLNKNVVRKVNEVQDGDISICLGSTSRADLLIDHPEYVIGVLRNQNTNQQLIFMPPKLHENAFLAGMQAQELKKVKVVIHNKVNDKLIGMDRGYIHELKKAESQKRKRDSKASSRKRARLDPDFTESNFYIKKEEEYNAEQDNTDNTENNVEQDSEEEENIVAETIENNATKLNNTNDSIKDIDDNSSSEENIESGYEEEEGYKQNADSDDYEEDNPHDQNADLEDDSDINNVKSEEEENDDHLEDDSYVSNVESEEEEENDDHLEDDSDVNNVKSEEEEENDIYSEEKNGNIGSESQNDASSSEEDELETNGKLLSGNKNYTMKLSKKQNGCNALREDKFVLPAINTYFIEPTIEIKEESDSDEEISEIETKEKKKKKLTPAERKEIARLEEEQLIKKEIENANSAAEPQTVEQFQKLVKGKPNCSKSWIKYIAHLVSNAEIEKAKEVAEEALQTIETQLIEERFNVWITRLNLENNYGDKNTFEEVFNEAVRCNDALNMYMSVIKILAESQKYAEMDEKILKAKHKFGRESLDMWIEIGRIYYANGRLKDARNAKDAGLLKLRMKTKQISLVVQFAIMEFTYGEKNQGEALFETLLQHNPKRVDIWITYIDQVIKNVDADAARRILDRAVSQSIPVKKLGTLFKKYKKFELEHGTVEQVQHVVELARKCAAAIE